MVYVFTFPLAVSLLANWDNVPSLFKRLATPTAASWVQAVGSVGAIVGLVWVFRAEGQRAAAVEEARQRAKLMAIGKIAYRAAAIVVVGAGVSDDDGNVQRWPRDGHRSALSALRAVDLSLLQDPVLIDLILSILWNSEQTLELVRKIDENDGDDNSNIVRVRSIKKIGQAAERTLVGLREKFPEGVGVNWRSQISLA